MAEQVDKASPARPPARPPRRPPALGRRPSRRPGRAHGSPRQSARRRGPEPAIQTVASARRLRTSTRVCSSPSATSEACDGRHRRRERSSTAWTWRSTTPCVAAMRGDSRRRRGGTAGRARQPGADRRVAQVEPGDQLLPATRPPPRNAARRARASPSASLVTLEQRLAARRHAATSAGSRAFSSGASMVVKRSTTSCARRPSAAPAHARRPCGRAALADPRQVRAGCDLAARPAGDPALVRRGPDHDGGIGAPRPGEEAAGGRRGRRSASSGRSGTPAPTWARSRSRGRSSGTPTPPVAPTDTASDRETTAVSSDCTATLQRPSSPTRSSERRSTAVSVPSSRCRTTQGSSPAARASASRQMSPPTMQIPVRTVATTRSPTPGTAATPAPAAASTTATTSSTAA